MSYPEFESWWRSSKGGSISPAGGGDDEWEDDRPRTASVLKQKNRSISDEMRIKPHHEISFEANGAPPGPRTNMPAWFVFRTNCCDGEFLHGGSAGVAAYAAAPTLDNRSNARHHVFDDTRGWRTKTQGVRRSRA